MTVNVTKPAINLREKLSELDKPSGIAGQDILKADTPQEVFNYIGAGRRNLIINGGFEISQRGDYSSNTATGQNAYRLDRWKHLVSVVTCNTRRDINQTVNGELMNVWRMEATSTGTGRFGIRQYVEATSTGRTPTAGKPTTLSVWMRSNNPNSRIYVYDYGTPGVLNSHVSHSGSGQWEKLSITFTPSTGSVTANGSGLELNFVCTTTVNGNVSVTSGDYIEIAQPQLEVGSLATPFEHRSYGEELALCQRYYQKFYSGDGSGRHFFLISDQNGAGHSHYLPFMTQMRAAPSTSTYVFDSLKLMEANGGYQTTGLTMQGTSVNSISGFAFYITGIDADRRDSICTLYDTSFTFTFDAEL